jgi:hypothetical protein
MKQLIYWFQINLINLINDIRRLFFNAKLKAYAWYYNGGKNIPIDKVEELIGPLSAESIEMFTALTKIMEICKKFGLELTDSNLAVLIVQLDMGKLEDVEVHEAAVQATIDSQTRLGAFKAMRAIEDISNAHMTTLRETGQYDSFMEWLKEPKVQKTTEVANKEEGAK